MSIEEQIKERLTDKIVRYYKHNPRRIYFTVNKEDIIPVAQILFRELGLRLSTCSGQDTPEGIEILYHFSFDQTGEMISVRVLIEDKKKPKIDSISTVFPGAEWIEREMWEMLGVNFVGHPNLKRLLLSEEWPEGKYPLRHEK